MSMSRMPVKLEHSTHSAPPDQFGTAVLMLVIYLFCARQIWQPQTEKCFQPAVGRLILNPNHANLHELMLLPDVGPRLGRAIIVYRQQAEEVPAFQSAMDLTAVRGIGSKTAAKLGPYLRFNTHQRRFRGGTP